MQVVPKLRNAEGTIARQKKIFVIQERERTWEITADVMWLNELSLLINYSL
jgi:hypothetical protein